MMRTRWLFEEGLVSQLSRGSKDRGGCRLSLTMKWDHTASLYEQSKNRCWWDFCLCHDTDSPGGCKYFHVAAVGNFWTGASSPTFQANMSSDSEKGFASGRHCFSNWISGFRVLMVESHQFPLTWMYLLVLIIKPPINVALIIKTLKLSILLVFP